MPTDPRHAYHATQFFTFQADAAGVAAALALKPDVAVMEPSGVNYQRVWGTRLAAAGVEVRLVANTALPAYRASLDLPDKDDQADALALACYYFAFADAPRRWLHTRDREIARTRETCLRLAHLTRVRSPILNRLRQDLAWQFPEIAHRDARKYSDTVAPLMLRWLAGRTTSKRYDREYAATVGSGIEESVTFAANQLCDLFDREMQLENDLINLVRSPERFKPYWGILDRFGFGLRTGAVIVSEIYPFENYLGDDGKPIIVVRKGKQSGKPTRRYVSLRRFKKSLGVAPSRQWSGQNDRVTRKSGSALCRKALWQWVFCRVEPVKARPRNAIGSELGQIADRYKAAKMPARKLRMKVAAKAVELLFREFSDAWASQEN
jgi:transposase